MSEISSKIHFSESEVSFLSSLVKINLSKDETKILAEVLSGSTYYLDLLNELDTSNVSPTYQVTGLENIFQKENLSGSKTLSQEEVLKNAKNQEAGYIKTEGVLASE